MHVCDPIRNLVKSSVKKMLTYCTSAATGLIGPCHVIQYSFHQKVTINAFFHPPIILLIHWNPLIILKIFIQIGIKIRDTSFHKIYLRLGHRSISI